MSSPVAVGLLWRWFLALTSVRCLIEAMSLRDWDDATNDAAAMLMLVFAVTVYHVALPRWIPAIAAWKRSCWPSAR
jgi:hypothetical protein